MPTFSTKPLVESLIGDHVLHVSPDFNEKYAITAVLQNIIVKYTFRFALIPPVLIISFNCAII